MHMPGVAKPAPGRDVVSQLPANQAAIVVIHNPIETFIAIRTAAVLQVILGLAFC
jgi:hypothetical protein